MPVAPLPIPAPIIILGLTEEQIRIAVHKAEKYDSVVKELQVADRGQYRADTLESVVMAARESTKTKGLIERIAAEWDGCMYQGVGEDIDVGGAIRATAKRAAV